MVQGLPSFPLNQGSIDVSSTAEWWRSLLCLSVCLFGIGLQQSSWGAQDDLYASPKFDEVRTKVLNWLQSQSTSDSIRQQVLAQWSESAAPQSSTTLLESVVTSFALVDPAVQELVLHSQAGRRDLNWEPNDKLLRTETDPFFKSNTGLYYGRYLIELKLYDEAWDVLNRVDERQVVDPASLFFFRAVAAQGILEIKAALKAIDQLLKNTEGAPIRFTAAAQLMQTELKKVEEKSLSEVARLMLDSERRLELGRAGEKIQNVQERIISGLDELIKKIEQQQNSGGGGGGGGEGAEGGESNSPDGPADDSRVKGSEAKGEVDEKTFETKRSWGNLPPKEVAKAKNDLNKNFPSHYEQAIEKYTKKLATRTAKKK